jgi:maleate cis-trans isomerase
MLVGKDQMTVICDSCRGTAKVKPIEEEAKSPTLSSNIGASTTDSR